MNRLLRKSTSDSAAAPSLWTTAEVARLLVSSSAVASIKPSEAALVAQKMRLSRAAEGTVLFRAGATHTDFMAMVLEGEAVVENTDAGVRGSVVLNVVQAGGVIGEMGVVANTPRSATVTASSNMVVAVLEQAAFAQLVRERPDVACGFLSIILKSLADRLRESNRKLLTLTKINRSMFDELEASQHTDSHLVEHTGSASPVEGALPDFAPTQAN